MTAPIVENQAQDQKNNEKDNNFRRLEQKYQAQMHEERNARLAAEKRTEELLQKHMQDDDIDPEPYVDHKRLKKEQEKFGQQMKQQTQTEIQKAVHHALQEERKTNWIKTNSDFYQVLEHAEKLALKDPDLAESILDMPESFERQKLVYKNIKALGLHKPEQREPSIQEKIDANRKSPYYQSTGVGSAPYQSHSDFSPGGQKQAYDKMKELQARLRI
jgi:hypothetical protein